MSEEYGSENAKNVESKTRAGENKTTYVKSSTFLPGVFNTSVNKKWLDSTLDQMLSKGELEDINAYVGSIKGNVRTADDVYLSEDPHLDNRVKSHLTPASVTTDPDGNITNVITFDDVANTVSNTFETYNYGAAYSTQAYNFAPPIDIDKFLNYNTYVWAPDMPVYNSINNNNAIQQSNINGQISYYFEDDNNSFWLQNGQRIKLSGAYGDNCVYMVAGVGKRIKLIKIINENNVLVYPFETKGSSVTSLGIWDNIDENIESTHWDFSFLGIKTNDKDYIVIDRLDAVQSAWSRNNHWVHRSTVAEMIRLCGIVNSPVMDSTRRAKRPIIEFNDDLEKYNMSNRYVGSIDYIVDNISNVPADIKVGDRVIFTTSPTNIATFNGTDYIFTTTVQDYTVATLINGWASTLSEYGDYVDVIYAKGVWKFAQQKTKMNQAPLFELFTKDGVNLAEFNESGFTGSKLFGYKEGTGIIDTELGFALARKDMTGGADILFENYLQTERYNTRDIVTDTYITSTDIPGHYYYKECGKLKIALEPRLIPLTAKHHAQQIFSGDDITFNVGTSAWEVEREFIIEVDGRGWRLNQLYSNGIYTRTNNVNFVLTKNRSYEFHNLSADKALVIHYINQVPNYNEGYTSKTFTIDFSNYDADAVSISLVDSSNNVFGITGKIIFIDSDATLYHNIKINGKQLKTTDYTIQEESIIVPSLVMKEGDIVDLEYYSNIVDSSHDIQVPEVSTHNAHNTIPDTFTLSETSNHWISLISSYPGFNGDALGINNAHSLPKINNTYGEIVIHDASTTGYDLTLADKFLDVEQALFDQARDWWAFKQRIIAQTRRLWASGTYYSVRQLASDSIAAVLSTKIGTSLYTDSAMLFNNETAVQEFVLAQGDHTAIIDQACQADDHLYVYLQTEINNVSIDRQLKRDIDFTLVGTTLTLLVPITATSGVLRVYQYPYGTASYVPPSLTKLRLSHVYEPQVVDGYIVCHDGSKHKLNSAFTTILDSLYNTNSASFDPVLGVLYDIETRIYSGLDLSKEYTDVSWAVPSQHRSRWFSNLGHVEDQIMFKYYTRWLLQSGRNVETEYPDATDTEGWSWNYSGIDYGHHIGTDVPGYWQGAYSVLFDTTTPHITPWQMLGFSVKPTWWDTQYSWTDVTKREQLIIALRNGIISDPSVEVKTDVRFARYYWDWVSRCPVTNTGDLELPKNVLIDDENDRVMSSRYAQPFAFSDWSPVQMEWRESALGHAAYLSAILKLQPANTWNEIFHVGQREYANGLMLDTNTCKVHSIDDELLHSMPGRRVKEIKVTTTNGVPNSQQITTPSRLLIVNGDPIEHASAEYVLDDNGLVSKIIITNRGFGYQNTPEIVLLDSADNRLFLDVEVVMEDDMLRTGGIDSVINNAAVRNMYNINTLDVFGNLDTRLVQKLGGFTSKHLIKFFTGSSIMPKQALSDYDYDLVTYRGNPSELLSASTIKITKLENGYSIDGFSPNKQLFYFNEPNITDPDSYTEVKITDGGATVRRYNKFSTATSTAEYGTKFKRIQDVYNFVRGYVNYLANNGYVLEQSADVYATGAAKWAMLAEQHESTNITLGSRIEYKPKHGTVLEINTLPNQANSIIDTNKRTIDTSNIDVIRTIESIIIEIKDDAIELGGVTFAVVDYEHTAIFKRTTEFNQVIFNDVTNQKYNRLKLKGQRTKDWHGKRTAPGFLVFQDKIIQNWDSAVDEIRDYYDTNVTKFNQGIERAETISTGAASISLFENAGLSQNTIHEFNKGLVKHKGTNFGLDIINRNDGVNFGDSIVKHNEVWMFREKAYGDLRNVNAVEIEIRQEEFKSNPQIVYFNNDGNNVDLSYNIIEVKRGETLSGNRPRYVNDGEVLFDTIEFNKRDEEYKFKTAGDLIIGEADYMVKQIDDISTVFDTIETIGTWSDKQSYKLSDLVRLDGNLYECNVPATGISLVGADVTISGQTRYPTMPYGSKGFFRASTSGDFVEVEFGGQSSALLGIVVQGTVSDPIVNSQNNIGLTIDGTFISLEQKQLVTVTSTYPSFVGVAFPEIPNALETGTLNINGVSINLADSNPPVPTSETLTGDGLTTTYNLDQNLGTYVLNKKFSIEVDTVTVDGTVLIAGTDYTVNESNNKITFTTPPGDDDLYVASGYVAEDYVYNGHVDVVVTYKVINYKSFEDIKAKVESSVSDVVVLLENNDLVIRGTSLTTGATLEIGTGTANDVLGLVEGIYTAGTSQIYDHTSLNLTEVIARINDANISGVQASEVNNVLYISSTNSSLVLAGTTAALSYLGLVSGTRIANATTINSPSDVDTIVDKMNLAFTAASEPLEVANVDGYLIIKSATDYMELGGTAFCNQTGFPTNNTVTTGEYINESTAVYSSEDTTVKNTFNETEWDLVNYKDPATVSIWVNDDSSFGYASLGGTQVRYNDWNIYKFMDFGYYSNGNDSCSICAGNLTSDGNDAEITMYKDGVPTDHGLQVGDHIMILNSTTSPSVDGIHKVTRINTNDTTKFYIDMYIDDCGTCPKILVMRSIRFNDLSDLEASVSKPEYYRYASNELVFVTTDSQGNEATIVYETATTSGNNASFSINPVPVRSTYRRPTNNDINNILLYDGQSNNMQLELEVYDPLMGLIPGIADHEIDFKSPIDFAVYTNSSQENAWGEGEIGKVWWDTSTLNYVDYTQGDLAYKTKYWGKLSSGASVDIYEWVKSDIPPEEWEDAVKSQTEILGIVASGDAYYTYNKDSDEYIYYYNEIQEWNKSLQKYTSVYYFWVKNKTTIESTRRHLTSKQISDIIVDPTAYGISWCAAIDDNALILSNIQQFIGGDTVLQINKKLENNSHRSWTAIEEKKGYIPDYWFNGARDNLVGYRLEPISWPVADLWTSGVNYNVGDVVRYNNKQYNCTASINSSETFELQLLRGGWAEQDSLLQTARYPDPTLHPISRYGDDRLSGQGWFKDIFAARREAIKVANQLMSTINMYSELVNGWDVRFNANKDLWHWVDYKTPLRSQQRPTLDLVNAGELVNVDITKHNVVNVLLRDSVDNRNVSEIYQYINGTWKMVEKKNATIEINDFLWNKARLASWDMQEWDGISWDNDNIQGMYDLITTLRENVFVDRYSHYFNTWWFSIIDYVLSEHDYVDWLYKTTYITLRIETPLEKQTKRYTRNNTSEIVGYTNNVKPFHTKIKEVFDTYSVIEVASVSLEDVESKTNICVRFPMTEAEISGELHKFIGNTYEGGDSDITVGSLSMSDNVSNVIDAGELSQPEMYNMNGRRYLFDIELGEHIAIRLETIDANNNDIRNVVYLRDDNENIRVYELRSDMQITIASEVSGDISEFADVLLVTNNSNIGTEGHIYVNGEILHYGQAETTAQGTILRGITRSSFGTYAKEHVADTLAYILPDDMVNLEAKQYGFAYDNLGNLAYNN